MKIVSYTKGIYHIVVNNIQVATFDKLYEAKQFIIDNNKYML